MTRSVAASSRSLRRDLAKTLCLSLIWIAILTIRSRWMKPHCAENPDICGISDINFFDRIWMGPSRPLAGKISDWLQVVAAIAAAVTLGWFHWMKRHTAHVRERVRDVLFLLRCTAVNGAFLEIVRMVFQRPRPFVIQEPLIHGGNIAHYTSMYSGHTSFTGVMAAGTMWILWKRGASFRFRLLHGVAALLIVVSTGALRVIDQAHYASDVLMGAMAAGFIPFLVTMLPGKDPWRALQ